MTQIESRQAAWARELRAVPGQVRTALEGQSEHAIRRRPAEGEWSAIEVAGHLVDKLDVWAERTRRATTEERPRLPGYDQDRYVREHGYQDLPRGAVLARLEQASERFVALVESLPDQALTRQAVHGESGPLTAARCIEAPLEAVQDHLRQLRAALALDSW